MIEEIETKNKLIEFKKGNSHVPIDPSLLGQVGRGYWIGFIRRNKDKSISHHGQKYELDRASWTTYRNVIDMYRHACNEMVAAGVVKVLKSPVWNDKEGNICEEATAYGCKVTHQITHPEYCVVMDEVGGNINQTGDGNVRT